MVCQRPADGVPVRKNNREMEGLLDGGFLFFQFNDHARARDELPVEQAAGDLGQYQQFGDTELEDKIRDL